MSEEIGMAVTEMADQGPQCATTRDKVRMKELGRLGDHSQRDCKSSEPCVRRAWIQENRARPVEVLWSHAERGAPLAMRKAAGEPRKPPR